MKCAILLLLTQCGTPPETMTFTRGDGAWRARGPVKSGDPVMAPAWAIASGPGGTIVEPVRTVYPKLTCDWTDREAQTFIHWRDFELHAAHEDREGGFCEANRLWTSTLMEGEDEKGSGFLVTKHGAGAYLGRVCRPLRDADTTATDCEESRDRAASACRPHPHYFSFPGAGPRVVVNCVSADPKRCR